MKTNNHIILVLLFTFCFGLICSAQKKHLTPSQELKIEKQDINNTPFIFEGTVISQVHQPKSAMVCSIVQITKIYRGSPQLKLGTIKVITEQSKNMQDGSSGLGRGHYIIFGSIYTAKKFDSTATDNNVTIGLADLSIAFSGNGAVWGQSHFKTVDSLYSFLKENGLTVQEEAEKK
jgi:hypothetical protein